MESEDHLDSISLSDIEGALTAGLGAKPCTADVGEKLTPTTPLPFPECPFAGVAAVHTKCSLSVSVHGYAIRSSATFSDGSEEFLQVVPRSRHAEMEAHLLLPVIDSCQIWVQGMLLSPLPPPNARCNEVRRFCL